MRTAFILPVLLSVLLPSCVFLDDGPAGSRSRADCSREGGRTGHGQSAPAGREPAAMDTTLWFSAVRFPKEYDWQRDTAYGSVPFELLLYKDFTPVLTLASGPDVCFSPDPDRHHLLGGHLYTERTTGGQTRIGRDGTELFRIEGREFLAGLLEDDGGDLYTLSHPGPDGSITLRRNGAVLYSHPDGIPYGSLSDPAYGPTGALYLDGGQVVFCFRAREGAIQSHYQVRDGEVSRLVGVPAFSVLDIRVRNGQPLILYPTLTQNRLSEGRLWPEADSYAVTGRFADGSGGWVSVCQDADDPSSLRILCREEAVLYHSQEASFAVAAAPEGVRWYGSDGTGQLEKDCRFPAPTCALALGPHLLLALAPAQTQGRPRVRFGPREETVDINGYVSGVGATFSPAAN